MAIRGLQTLYNLILKDIVKGSGQASGILSIGKDVRKLADKKFQNYVMTAQKQGVDLDKLSEQEIKYMLELNKTKAPKVLSNEDAVAFLNQFLKQNEKGKVIKADFGKPFADEVSSADNAADDILVEQMYRTSGPRDLETDSSFLASFIAEDAGKVLDDLPIEEQTKFIERAKNALRRNVKQYQPRETEIIEGIQTTKGLGDLFPKQLEKTITVESVIADIKKLEPIESMKETNKVLRGDGKYKNLSQADREKIASDESVTDHIFERNIEPDPEDFAGGGIAGMLGEPTYEDDNHRVPYQDGLKVYPQASVRIGEADIPNLPIEITPKTKDITYGATIMGEKDGLYGGIEGIKIKNKIVECIRWPCSVKRRQISRFRMGTKTNNGKIRKEINYNSR